MIPTFSAHCGKTSQRRRGGGRGLDGVEGENPSSFNAGLRNVYNTFGHLFRVTTFGESHGPAIGCVVDGCPPGICLSEADIQPFLDKRRPGHSRFTSQRREPDAVKILLVCSQTPQPARRSRRVRPSGCDRETVDQRSKDYSEITDTSSLATRTTPMTSSTGSATTAAVAASPPARPQRGLRLERLHARSLGNEGAGGRSSRWGRTRSSAPAGIGRRWSAIPSSVLTRAGQVPRGYLDTSADADHL